MSMNMNMNMNMNQMSSAIQQAIYDNNEGARSLRKYHYDEAVKSFTSVLQILKPLAVIVEEKQKHAAAAQNSNTRHHSSCYEGNDNDDSSSSSSNSTIPFNISFNQMKPTDDDDDDDDDDTYDENDSRGIAHHHVHTSSSPSRISVSSSQSSTSPVDYASSSSFPSPSATNEHEFPQQRQRKLKHFVFRDPVSIPTPSNMNSEDHPSSYYSPALFSKFLMIVMYNLALTLHLQALSLVSSSISTSTSAATVSSSDHHLQHQTHKKNIKQLFKRSRKLYELAFELQLETDVDPLFTLALTNNLGLIYRTVNERKKCLICFRNMFSTMMYLIDAHQTNSQSYEPSSSLHSRIKNWDGFLSNAMDLLFKHTYEVVAAAA